MDRQLMENYKKFRAIGYQASNALYCAKVLTKWDNFGAGIRLIKEIEEEGYFDVYGEPDTEKEKKDIIEYIEKWGLWYIQGQYETKVCECCGRGGDWEYADSVGMCCYENPLDPFENCFVIDMMQAAMDAYEKDREEE